MLLTRDGIIDALNELIVVPATRTIRGLETEVLLSPEDGMPTACALNFDHVSLAQRSRLGAAIATLPPAQVKLSWWSPYACWTGEPGPVQGSHIQAGLLGRGARERRAGEAWAGGALPRRGLPAGPVEPPRVGQAGRASDGARSIIEDCPGW